MKNTHTTPFNARPLALEISRMFRPGVAASAASAVLAVPLAFAAPQGGSVTAGQAGIQQNGATTTITQGSQRAAIDWRSFNVGSSETVNFIQPNASSAILNRVVGNEASAIFGRITANGQVYLVNPNGILFGRSAQVDVGALTATTANISNGNFMAGKLDFNQPGKAGARVENQGRITVAEGGFAALVGHNVANSGVINARLGKVTLAAGDAFVLDLYGDKLVNLIVDPAAMNTLTDAAGNPLAASVDHSGEIVAEGGRVQLSVATVKQLVDNLINVSGVIRATSFINAPGVISLQGDAQTKVAVSGTLDASAGARGNGGTVDVLSDGSTQFTGHIAARGGADGGDGGHVEVSAKGKLGFFGTVDMFATQGRQGSLLLDPTDLKIGTVTTGDSEVSADQLRYFLVRGGSVTLAADRNITVDAEVNGLVTGGTGVAGGGLTLTAGNNLTVNQTIALNDGALTLTATSGTLSTTGTALLYTGTGNATLRGGAGVDVGPVLSGGAVDIRSASGTVNVRNAIVAASANGTAAPVASLNVVGAGNVSLHGALVQGNAVVHSDTGHVSLSTAVIQSLSGNVEVVAGGSIATTANNVGLLSAGTVNATAGQAIDLGAVIGNGAVTLSSTGGGVAVHQAVTGSGTAPTSGLTINAAGAVALAGANTGAGGISITTSSGNITSQGASASEGGLLSTGGVTLHADGGQAGTTAAPLNVNATGNMLIDGQTGVTAAALLGRGNVAIEANAGSVAVSQAISGSAGAVNTATASRPVGVNVTARDAISLAGAAAGTGGITIDSTAGGVNLTSSLFSAGRVSVSAQGAIALPNGVGIDTTRADASRNVDGSVSVVSRAGTVTLGNAGIRTNGQTSSVSLSSVGDLSVNGDIKTDGDSIDLVSSAGAVRVLASYTDNTQAANATLDAGTDVANSAITVRAAGDVELGEMMAYNGVDIASSGGNVVLRRGLGGNAFTTVGGQRIELNTGYVNHADGYQAQYRPNVGRVKIVANTGSVELNGINIDGNTSPTDPLAGLSVVAGQRIVSNDKIAVNKGDIVLTGGNGATDGVYLGNSVYSRGYDTVVGGVHQKTAYRITIGGRVLGLFDNTLEMAQLPLDNFTLSWQEGGQTRTAITDAEGFVVDATGERVRNPNGTFRAVGYRLDNVTLDVDDLRIYDVDANAVSAGVQILTVQGLPSLSQQEIAKIEIANNVANYQDTAHNSTLVPATLGTVQGRTISIGSQTIAGVANSTPQAPIRVAGFAPSLTTLRQTPIHSAPTDAGVAAAVRGIGLKALAFQESGDASSQVWADVVQILNGGGSTFFRSGSLEWGAGQSTTLPLDGVFSVSVPALATRSYMLNGSLETETVILPEAAGDAVHTFRLDGGVIDGARLINVDVSGVSTASLSNSLPATATLVSGWAAKGWQPVDSIAGIRLVNPDIQEKGVVGGVAISASLYPAVTGTPSASGLQASGIVEPNYRFLVPDGSLNIPVNGGVHIYPTSSSRPHGYEVRNIVADSSATTSAYGANLPGTRVFVYDGIIDSANGTRQFDSNPGTQIPGLGTIGGNNNSTVGFAGVGVGFGSLAGGSATGAGSGAASGQGAGGATPPSGQAGSGTAPPVPETAPVDVVPVLPSEGADGASPVGSAEGDVLFGVRPGAQADLGRGGAVPGSAFNVFKYRYRLGKSSSSTVCAPESLQQTPPTDGKTERNCPAAK